MIKILIVDDEEMICEFVEAYLKREGYETIVSYNGQDAINKIDNNKLDLIILDRKLPDVSGEEICKYIREISDIPIIMITSKNQHEEKIEGFNLGCDDYVCKPFNPEELIMRVKVMLKRSGVSSELIVKYKNGLEINQSNRTVKFKGRLVDLTKTEYDILMLITSNPNKVYKREEILFSAIEESYEKLDRSIDNHIKNIRKKIEPDSKKSNVIKTIYGVGYKFEQE